MVWVDRVRRRLRIGVLLWAAITVVSIAGATLVVYDQDPEPRLSLDCLPFAQPRTVGDLNETVARYRAMPGFVGADVGASVTLSDGRSLWVFGDTLRPK